MPHSMGKAHGGSRLTSKDYKKPKKMMGSKKGYNSFGMKFDGNGKTTERKGGKVN